MTCYIEFEDSPIGVVHYTRILRLSFICSIFKVFSMANVVLNGLAKKYFNDMKSGLPVNFVFVDDNGKEYINKMKVLSFSKLPDSEFNTSDIMEVTFISAMYFDKSSGTLVHEGSVGTIYDNIMSKFFRISVREYSGISTEDIPRRRYQTGERTLDFMKRILKYGVQGNMPVYLFHDAKGVLNLRGISEMSKSIPEYTAIPALVGTSENMSQSSTNAYLLMWDFISEFNGRTTASRVDNIFTTSNFRFNDKVMSSYSFRSLETGNSQIFDSIPSRTKFYGWNLAPNDAFAISAKESFESTANSCILKGTFKGMDVGRLGLGSTIDVQLPTYGNNAKNSKGEAANLGEGRYLITDLEFSITKDGVQTVASMMQVAC